MKKAEIGIAVLMVILVAFGGIGTAKAWGVAYGEKVLELNAGDTYQIRTSLQNMVDEDELTIFIKLEGDTEIATLSEKEVKLQPKTRSHPVYITVKIPENPKDLYMIKAIYTESPEGGIMVNMATQKIVTFKIHTSGTKSPSPPPQNNDNEHSSRSSMITNEDKNDTIREETPNNNTEKTIKKQLNNENIPSVPIEETLNESSDENEEPTQTNDGLLWLAIAIMIIAIIGYMWWIGWI